jgi:hypothetical protein
VNLVGSSIVLAATCITLRRRPWSQLWRWRRKARPDWIGGTCRTRRTSSINCCWLLRSADDRRRLEMKPVHVSSATGVILLTFTGISKDAISKVDGNQPFGRVLPIAGEVRMEYPNQVAVPPRYVLLRGIRGNAKNFIVVRFHCRYLPRHQLTGQS